MLQGHWGIVDFGKFNRYTVDKRTGRPMPAGEAYKGQGKRTALCGGRERQYYGIYFDGNRHFFMRPED